MEPGPGPGPPPPPPPLSAPAASTTPPAPVFASASASASVLVPVPVSVPRCRHQLHAPRPPIGRRLLPERLQPALVFPPPPPPLSLCFSLSSPSPLDFNTSDNATYRQKAPLAHAGRTIHNAPVGAAAIRLILLPVPDPLARPHRMPQARLATPTHSPLLRLLSLLDRLLPLYRHRPRPCPTLLPPRALLANQAAAPRTMLVYRPITTNNNTTSSSSSP